MSHDGLCVQCRRPLPDECDRRRQFCDECRAARKYQNAVERRKARYVETRREERKKMAPKTTAYKSLDQMAREARALHLTYGQYSALIMSGGLEQYCQVHRLTMPK